MSRSRCFLATPWPSSRSPSESAPDLIHAGRPLSWPSRRPHDFPESTECVRYTCVLLVAADAGAPGPPLMATDVKHAATPTPPAALAATRPASIALPTFLPAVLAAGAGVAFAALTCWMAFTSYSAFHTGRFDLEIYTQVVWNIANAHGFGTTLLKSNLNHLAEHVALVLVPIAGLYRLLPDPRLLLGIQQIGLALLGWPLFIVGRRLLGPWAALVVVVCFYLTPSLAGVA